MSLVLLLITAIVIFVLWHFLPQTEKRAPLPAPKYRQDPRVTPDQVRWQGFVEEHCESPAEIAFLRAMIEDFKLSPQNGSLVADGVRLDFQVKEGRYRVDFLANEWLVVEIDGAAYHSSPEAKARDRLRDRYFESLGYSVLRIPAKLVFQSPSLAVGKVRTALTEGKRESPPAPKTAATGFQRLAQTAEGFNRSMEEMRKRQLLRTAIAEAEAAVAEEKRVLALVLDHSKQWVEHEAWLASLTPERRAEFDKTLEMLNASAPSSAEPLPSPVFVSFSPPKQTGDPWVDDLIEKNVERLATKRTALFQEARAAIERDGRLKAPIREALKGFGREDIWMQVSQQPDRLPVWPPPGT